VNQTIIIPKLMPRERAVERITEFIKHLPTDKAWAIEVREYNPRRSDQQNRYLWGVCYATLLNAPALAGWDAEDLHEYFLGEHFGWETLEGLGRKRVRPIRRSSRLSKMEFADFIDFIQRKAAEFGVFIPDADPAHWDESDAQ
jgi:hypothetical protein